MASASANSIEETCTICLEPIEVNSTKKATSKLICGHVFHMCCIGCAFNAKGKMECPNCRSLEDSDWLFTAPQPMPVTVNVNVDNNRGRRPAAPARDTRGRYTRGRGRGRGRGRQPRANAQTHLHTLNIQQTMDIASSSGTAATGTGTGTGQVSNNFITTLIPYLRNNPSSGTTGASNASHAHIFLPSITNLEYGTNGGVSARLTQNANIFAIPPNGSGTGTWSTGNSSNGTATIDEFLRRVIHEPQHLRNVRPRLSAGSDNPWWLELRLAPPTTGEDDSLDLRLAPPPGF